MAKVEGMVKISAQEYLTLLERSADLFALEEAGVDSWDGWEEVERRRAAENAVLRAAVEERRTE